MDTTQEMDQLASDSPRIDVRRRVLLRAPGLMALGSLAAVSLGQSMPAWAQTQSACHGEWSLARMDQPNTFAGGRCRTNPTCHSAAGGSPFAQTKHRIKASLEDH